MRGLKSVYLDKLKRIFKKYDSRQSLTPPALFHKASKNIFSKLYYGQSGTFFVTPHMKVFSDPRSLVSGVTLLPQCIVPDESR